MQIYKKSIAYIVWSLVSALGIPSDIFCAPNMKFDHLKDAVINYSMFVITILSLNRICPEDTFVN